MCLPSAPSFTPPTPAGPGPAAAPPPTRQDAPVRKAGTRDRARQALAAGRSSTILTNPLGLAGSGSTARKTLLGT